MMFNRAKLIKKEFVELNLIPTPKNIKYRCVRCVFMQKLEYAQVVSGRCISVRNRRFTKSILVRNKKYGVEVRYFLNNPRLLIFY